MSLDNQAKGKVLTRVCELVKKKHFDPGMNGANWEELSKSRRDQILRSNSDEEFEKQMQDLLAELKTSHTGFRHSKSSKIPGRHAIAATFMRCGLDGDQRCFKTSTQVGRHMPQVCVLAIFFSKFEIES